MIKSISPCAEIHPDVLIIKEYLGHIGNFDLVSAKPFLDPEVSYIVPGHNRFSGIAKGPEAVMNYCMQVMKYTENTHAVTSMNWLTNEDKVILITDNIAKLGEKELIWKEAFVVEVIYKKIRRIEMFQEDQGAFDLFFS